MSKTQTFIDRCLSGSAFLDDIDDFVDEWHDGEGERPIWRYLGMKKAEYALWVERPEALRFIVSAHRQNIDVKQVLLSNERELVAARSDHPDEAERILKWLERTGRIQ